MVRYPEPYVQPLIVKALEALNLSSLKISTDASSIAEVSRSIQFAAYEDLDFETAIQHPTAHLICAYVIRKALIRKHYLSNTVATWLTKHPDSILQNHFKPSIHFELDYAEFLDDALVDAWDLHESMTRNAGTHAPDQKEWWILKPGMSDGGNGIRLFSDLDELQEIFNEWDPDSDDEEEEEFEDDQNRNDMIQMPPLGMDNLKPSTASDEADNLMTSQLRHFIVQPYIASPLLLPSMGGRKFHVRTYVVAVGSLKVFVFHEMLALFAAQKYYGLARDAETSPDLSAHLTNTCFQNEETKADSVRLFWKLEDNAIAKGWQEKVFKQICEITGEIFEAAAREQMVHFQTLPNAFEVFGVDFLVDAECNAWLLELNAYPDFKQTGARLQSLVVGQLFQDIVEVAVAPFFGQKAYAKGTKTLTLVKDVDLGRR